ncbi:unnamed protein product [Diatraea saccharalis]|uniref:TIL domain-containing protein n=1 Tax=Diatraea saccharalis TaxID=40085 RepID=A0A9N9QXA8_9NEOP|nr:unnamed protein product [Diatraea saccharalis]
MKNGLFIIITCFVFNAANYVQKPKPLYCGPNEVETCAKKCPPEKTCRNRGIMISCLNDPCPCTRKCVCADGYYRNAIGECITGEQCDRCQKPNEFYSCNSACDNECINIYSQNRTNCPIKNIQCNERCYCDDGYARDASNNCIPVNQCNVRGRDPNEVYTCSRSCPPDLCISTVAFFKCNSNEPEKLRYRCKPGYLREEDGSPCIPICQCPQMRDAPECQRMYLTNKVMQNY